MAQTQWAKKIQLYNKGKREKSTQPHGFHGEPVDGFGPEMPLVESIAEAKDHEQPLLSFLRHNMKYNIQLLVFVCACGVVDCCGLLWCGDGGRQAKTEADSEEPTQPRLLKLQ